MATIRKTITLSDSQDAWIKAQIARGAFTNDSEYIRDLIRRDQEGQNSLAELPGKTTWQCNQTKQPGNATK